MGFQVQKTLVCDRCGKSVPVANEAVPAIEFREKFPGWAMVCGERALCPDCVPGYDLLTARHKVELEDYISGK